MRRRRPVGCGVSRTEIQCRSAEKQSRRRTCASHHALRRRLQCRHRRACLPADPMLPSTALLEICLAKAEACGVECNTQRSGAGGLPGAMPAAPHCTKTLDCAICVFRFNNPPPPPHTPIRGEFRDVGLRHCLLKIMNLAVFFSRRLSLAASKAWGSSLPSTCIGIHSWPGRRAARPAHPRPRSK